MPETGPTAVLLLACPDRRGIAAAVTDFVYRHDGNLIDADQHTDREVELFLQRIEWTLDGFAFAREEIGDAFRPLARRFGMEWELHFSDEVPRLALFVSKLDHCLYDLLLRWRAREISADVRCVVSNHPDLAPIAEHFGLPYYHHPTDAATRASEEERILERLAAEAVDLVVLARFMQVLPATFVARYPRRIINIHHSFLPAFAGGRPYHQAYERGVKVVGATAHYVTAELDEGPIIEQDVARVSHRDTVEDMVRKGRDLERVVLARAVDLHLRHRVLVYGNKTVVFD